MCRHTWLWKTNDDQEGTTLRCGPVLTAFFSPRSLPMIHSHIYLAFPPFIIVTIIIYILSLFCGAGNGT